MSKSLKSHAAGLCVAAELGFRWASLMGVVALVVMEKRALFRIIFLDQKKRFIQLLWQHMLAKETIFVLLPRREL